MKKTLSIHIKGILFIVEEDAFETLQSYLARLEQKLGNTEGKTEIIEDIELRIAEIFSEIQAGDSKRVIIQNDVDQAIQILGEPEDYIDNDGTENNDSQENTQNFRSDKKLFRDVENATIAGVCSGLAAYFNIDVLIVRIIFLIVLFFGGFGIPLYIILWAVLPKVNSNVDRLRMQGRPVTVESLRDEVEGAARRMTDKSEKMARKLQRDNVFQNGVNAIGKIIRFGLGILFIFFGIVGVIFYFAFVLFDFAILPISNSNGLYSLYQFSELFWSSTTQVNIIYYVGAVISAILIGHILITGIRFTFNLPLNWFKYYGRVALVAIIAGVILAFYGGTTLMKEYIFESEVVKKMDLNSPALHIELEKKSTMNSHMQIHHERHGNNFWLREKNGLLYDENIRIRYTESKDSLYHISISSESHGLTEEIAFRNAKNIRYETKLQGDTLHLAKEYAYPKRDKIRGQDVDVFIQIPKGKKVYVGNEIIDLNEPKEEEYEYEDGKTMYINSNGEIHIYN